MSSVHVVNTREGLIKLPVFDKDGKVLKFVEFPPDTPVELGAEEALAARNDLGNGLYLCEIETRSYEEAGQKKTLVTVKSINHQATLEAVRDIVQEKIKNGEMLLSFQRDEKYMVPNAPVATATPAPKTSRRKKKEDAKEPTVESL